MMAGEYGRANAGGNQVHRDMTLRERRRVCQRKHKKSWKTKTMADGAMVTECPQCGGSWRVEAP